MSHKHTSQHRGKDGKPVKVPRNFAPEHLAANYHLAEFSGHSTPDHELHGEYQGYDGRIIVRHLEKGPTEGPEFEIEVENGPRITTLHEDAVIFHLAQFGAAEHA
jgi:hypothetical protein